MPRGRFEEPERPTEASREDAAAEDEPAERAVSPVSAEVGPVRGGRWSRVGHGATDTEVVCRGGGGVAVSSLSPAGRRGLRGDPREGAGRAHSRVSSPRGLG